MEIGTKTENSLAIQQHYCSHGELNNATLVVRCKAYIIFVKTMRQIINFGSVTYKPKHYKLKSMPMNVRYLLSVSPCRKYYNLKAVNPPAADRHIFVPIPFNFRWIPQSDESSTSSTECLKKNGI